MFKTAATIIFSFFLTFGLVSIPSEQQEKTSILYFGATWCGPCKQMKKLFNDEEVKKVLDKYDFVMYDYDENKSLAKKYGVKYLPTMIFKKNGKVINKETGYIDKKCLLQILEKYLK